ncbi:hypothetical protein AN630_04905 [Limosilactobacillus fermentum]|nr:hypothetical protein AN630_04905 [Limosilactobacillus fermentum]
MIEMLQPTDLAHALTHDRADQRARALLNLGWETRPNALVNDLVTAGDVQLARRLQANGIVAGKVNLADYRSCAQLVAHHGGWLSAGAKRRC